MSRATPMIDRIDTVLDTLMRRLADPDHTELSGATTQLGPTLNREAGLALLYAELGHGAFGESTPGCEPLEHRRTAHRNLVAASQTLQDTSQHGLYNGVPAVAFAASTAVQHDGDYATMLAKLDEALFPIVRSALDAEHARLRDGGILHQYASFDLLLGMTGLGRYLLRRCAVSAEAESLLRGVLECFAGLARPITRGGIALPGWWVEPPPDENWSRMPGHVNLGLAHGIPGPLALLSSAWRTGVRIVGHAELIETITDFLLDWSDVDDYGRYWPASLSQQQYTNRPAQLDRARQAWCYGSPGVARAVQLAGLALDRADWLATTRETVQGMFRLPEQEWGVQDACLCHGWSGLLHVLGRIRADDPDSVLAEQLDWLAERTVAPFDPDLPYGYPQANELGDNPTLLTGSTGIALALLAYRTGTPPASGWDAAILLD